VELPGPRAKLDWAVKHLETLDREREALLETEPFFVASEFDQDAGCHVLSFRVRKDPWFLRLGLMVGDVIHNARSALDQAVWLVACRSNPIEMLWRQDVGRKIAFPVLSEEKAFPRHKVMPFISDDAKAVLGSLQPYKGGDTPVAIERLDRLWNIDKHRVIHSSMAQLDISGVTFRPGAIHMEDLIEGPETTHYPIDGLKDGTKIASVRFRDGRGPPLTKVEVKGKPTALIAFGSGFFALPVDGIGSLLVHTDKALSLIEALPEKAPASRASTEMG
jgi:hypothetical protein